MAQVDDAHAKEENRVAFLAADVEPIASLDMIALVVVVGDRD